MSDFQVFVGALSCIWFVGLLFILALGAGKPRDGE